MISLFVSFSADDYPDLDEEDIADVKPDELYDDKADDEDASWVQRHFCELFVDRHL